MDMIRIRGIDLKPAAYTDRDLLRLTAAISDTTLDEAIAEKNAASIMRRIFPSMPEDWTANGRLCLHNTELLTILSRLQTHLMRDDDEFVDSLEPLRVLPNVAGAIDSLKTFRTAPNYGDYEYDRRSSNHGYPKSKARNKYR